MPVSTRLAVFAILSLPLGTALAQTSSQPDTATLLKRIEQQDKKIEALEHKLEALEEQQAAAAGTKQPSVATSGAQPGAPSTAVQGATAAVSQRAGTARQAPGLVSAGSVPPGDG